ncbi:MAG: hypothetical protein KA247_07660 [Bacteroidetes bacterium]|nr:hypothetical protein [Bacteroidota bacterium]
MNKSEDQDSTHTEGISAQPVIDEFKGKPIIRIPIVPDPNPQTSWHWLTFGKSKAKAIIAHIDAIRKFADS